GELADRVITARRDEARELIDRGYLDRLGVIIGDDLDAGIERWRGLAERITLSVPWFGTNDSDQLDQIERLIERIRTLEVPHPQLKASHPTAGAVLGIRKAIILFTSMEKHRAGMFVRPAATPEETRNASSGPLVPGQPGRRRTVQPDPDG